MDKLTPAADLFRPRFEALPPRVEEFRRWLATSIPCAPNTAQARAELDAMPLPALVTVYLNWAQRLIPVRPRKVAYGGGFWDSAALKHHAEVETLAAVLESGGDLTPFLSTRALREGYAPTPDAGRRHRWAAKDFALNAWRVHHLHLSPKRTRPLLYLFVERESATLLLVGDHKSFDDGTLERRVTAARAAEGRFVLKGVTPSPDHTPVDRIKFARYGISTVAAADGKTVMGSMMSTDGTSFWTTRYVQEVLHTLRHVDPNVGEAGWVRSVTTPPVDMAAPAYRFIDLDLCIVSPEAPAAARLLFGPC